jgi:DHA2 family multidrug resistance protein
MMPAVLLRGLGLGFLFLSITLIAFDRLPRDHLAVGIALFSIGRQLGGMLGLAGLQTLLDHEMAVSRTLLGTSLVAGEPAVAERLASMTALVMARGLEPGAAGQVATTLLGRTVSGQAAVIAFDTAFAAVALLFVAAAPIVIGIRIALSRAAARRVREIEAAGS